MLITDSLYNISWQHIYCALYERVSKNVYGDFVIIVLYYVQFFLDCKFSSKNGSESLKKSHKLFCLQIEYTLSVIVISLKFIKWSPFTFHRDALNISIWGV